MNRLHTWTPEQLLQLATDIARKATAGHPTNCTCARCNTARRERDVIQHITDRRTEDA